MYEIEEKPSKYGRYITIIRFADTVDVESLARTLKRRLATGGTVKNGVIILQGRHKEKLKTLLPRLLADINADTRLRTDG